MQRHRDRTGYGTAAAANETRSRLLNWTMLLAIVFAVLGIGIVVLGNMVIVPLGAHWDERALAYDKANTYLNHKICTDIELKEGLRGYDPCKESREVVGRSPLALAVRDVLEDYWCEKGKCLVPRFDPITLLFNVVPTMMLVGVIVIVGSACWMFVRLWRNNERANELPFVGGGVGTTPVFTADQVDRLINGSKLLNNAATAARDAAQL